MILSAGICATKTIVMAESDTPKFQCTQCDFTAKNKSGLTSNIQMYGYKLPVKTISIDPFGEGAKEGSAQVYHLYEAAFLDDFHKKYKFLPELSFNYMPDVQ